MSTQPTKSWTNKIASYVSDFFKGTNNVSSTESSNLEKNTMATLNFKFSTNDLQWSAPVEPYSTNTFVKTIEVGVKINNMAKSYIIVNDFNKGDYTHANFLQYIALAYANEHGIILRPDLFHYTISSEITRYIFDNVKKFRQIFTDSDKKKDILINSSCDDSLIEAINIALDAAVQDKDFKDLFTGVKFKSEPANFDLVKKIMFAHSATPYYDYYSTMCGFPVIQVIDNKDDWTKLLRFISGMQILMEKYNEDELIEYLKNCKQNIEKLINTAFKNSKKTFLQEIFMVEKDPYYRCGSGHDLEYRISGWILDFYLKRAAKVDCFPPHLPYLPFHDLDNNKNYVIVSGLMNSNLVGNVLIPSYEKITYEV